MPRPPQPYRVGPHVVTPEAAPRVGGPIWGDGRCQTCGARAVVVLVEGDTIVGRYCLGCDPTRKRSMRPLHGGRQADK